MKKTYISTLIVAAIVATSCEPQGFEPENNGKVTSIAVKEAVYVSSGTPSMQISFKDNEELQLNVVILPQNAKNQNVTFANKHPELMEVTDAGILKAKAVGTDTLTVSATDGSGVQTRFIVNIIDHMVKATAVNVTAAGSNIALKIGGTTFNLNACVSLLPADTWNKAVSYTSNDESVATVNASGIVSPVSAGTTTITIRTTDGSNLSKDCNVTVAAQSQIDLDRTLWTARTSAAIEGSAGGFNYSPTNITWVPDRFAKDGIPNAVLTGMPEHLFDSDATTFLSMLKPGKSDYSTGPGTGWDVSQPATIALQALLGSADKAVASVTSTIVNYFVVDMQSPQTFSYVRWTHRNATRGLQAWGINIYGSNDGTTWSEKLNGESPIQLDSATADKRLWITANQDKFTYRYVKVVIALFDAVNSSNVQVGEFGLGNLE